MISSLMEFAASEKENGTEMDFITVRCSNLSQSVGVKEKMVLVTTVLAQYLNSLPTKYKNKLNTIIEIILTC